MPHLPWPRRRSSSRALIALATASLALAAAGCGGSGSSSSPSSSSSSSGDPATTTGAEQTQRLRFAGFVGEATSVGQLWAWWMDEVERRSEGSIEFEAFWDGTLLRGPETLDGLRDGRADLGHVVPPMYPGKFPLTSVTELPFASDNVPAGAAAIQGLVDRSEPLRAEWDAQGMHPLAWNIGAPGPIGSADEIATAADLEGMRIRGNDRSSKALQAAGANLVNLDIADVYGAMERDLVNGYFGVPFAFVGQLKLDEVSDHLLDAGLGITSAGPLAISDRRWQSLSDRQRAVMAEVSAEAPAKLGELVGAADDATCRQLRSSGMELTALADGEVDKLRAAGEARLVDEWGEEAARSGVSPDEFRKAWLDAVRAAEEEHGAYEDGLKRCIDGGEAEARQ